MSDKFCAFILTHGRPDKVYTYKTLKKHGYTGKIFFILDDEDKTADKYIENYGEENILFFSKSEIAKKFDEADNFNQRQTIVYARNACFDLAEQEGYKYFIQLDDDYTIFRHIFNNENKYITSNINIKDLDKTFKIMLDFFKEVPIASVAMAQGGDFIGGGDNGTMGKLNIQGKPSRKAMNSFICSTDRRFYFKGRINEDVNTYTRLASIGKIFFTIPRLALGQKQTQTNSGGMTETYMDSGTYIKSFYTVMFHPSSVTIRLMGNKDMRLHHSVKWKNTVPEILSEKYKK